MMRTHGKPPCLSLVVCGCVLSLYEQQQQKKIASASGIESYKSLWEPPPLGLSFMLKTSIRKINLITKSA